MYPLPPAADLGRAGRHVDDRPAASALRDEYALPFLGQIGEERIAPLSLACGLLVDQRADRNRELEIGAAVAGAIGANAVLAALARNRALLA